MIRIKKVLPYSYRFGSEDFLCGVFYVSLTFANMSVSGPGVVIYLVVIYVIVKFISLFFWEWCSVGFGQPLIVFALQVTLHPLIPVEFWFIRIVEAAPIHPTVIGFLCDGIRVPLGLSFERSQISGGSYRKKFF